jgi:Cu+-exporting ATPase
MRLSATAAHAELRWSRVYDRVTDAFGLVLLLLISTYIAGSLLPFHGVGGVVIATLGALSATIALATARARTQIVMWAGRPFFERGWASIVNRHMNMFTLIALGVGAAYAYSLAAVLAPGIFPAGFRFHGVVEPYFDTAVAVTVLVLVGQVMELRARGRTGAAIRALLGMAAKTARAIRDGREIDVPIPPSCPTPLPTTSSATTGPSH